MKPTKEQIIEIINLAKELIKVARCPDCDGSGTVVHGFNKDGTIQENGISPCYWCYEKDRFIKLASEFESLPEDKGLTDDRTAKLEELVGLYEELDDNLIAQKMNPRSILDDRRERIEAGLRQKISELRKELNIK